VDLFTGTTTMNMDLLQPAIGSPAPNVSAFQRRRVWGSLQRCGYQHCPPAHEQMRRYQVEVSFLGLHGFAVAITKAYYLKIWPGRRVKNFGVRANFPSIFQPSPGPHFSTVPAQIPIHVL